jgi:hypothetical protein
MATPIPYPLINGARHGFSSIELKIHTQIFKGFKSLNFNRTRSRGLVRGNHPDPIGYTRGENEYKADCEIYLAEWALFQQILGVGYGDVAFPVLVTYGENAFDAITVELTGCHMDSTDFSHGQGTDALTVKCDLNPLKIVINGVDDTEFPLTPPPGG